MDKKKLADDEELQFAPYGITHPSPVVEGIYVIRIKEDGGVLYHMAHWNSNEKKFYDINHKYSYHKITGYKLVKACTVFRKRGW